MTALDTVIRYHDATKHHPHRFARSLGYLDWDTQPNPFRRFDGAPLVRLPIPGPDDTPPYEELYQPGAIRPSPVSAASLSRFFECSLAISAWKQFNATRWPLRCNPSSGNLHPTEGYVVLPAVDGIGATPGVYHYAPLEHALERRATFDDAVFTDLLSGQPRGSFLVGLTSIYWREAWKYGERAYRYCHHDVGHALGALRIAVAMMGWRMAMLDELSDDACDAALLGLDRTVDFTDAEPEHGDLIAAVSPSAGPLRGGIDAAAVACVAAGAWTGRANRLSRDHVDWPIIDEVSLAAVRPPLMPAPRAAAFMPRVATRGVNPAARGGAIKACSDHRSQVSARTIIQQRRSAVAFDGETRIDAATFYHILSRVVPHHGPAAQDPATRSRVPFDVIPWRPTIHFAMFVHLVEGIPPGLYALLRDPAARDRLKAAMSSDFTWSDPPQRPADLPLYLLGECDCRRAAAQLSLGQDIAGMGVFSLGMIADFEAPLAEHGPWFYPRLFWEAGLVGQVLYLEAEAAGIRATGIGAYFDDPVHEIFGLTGRAFQSMYHFTMGGPVEDTRLTTLPAYEWEGGAPAGPCLAQ